MNPDHLSKSYRGYRRMHLSHEGNPTTEKCVVMVFRAGKHARPLRPRNDIRNHSPDGFEWGYCGSGPAQLALALVADIAGKAYATPNVYQHVKARLVANFPKDGWVLTGRELMDCIETILAEKELFGGDDHPLNNEGEQP